MPEQSPDRLENPLPKTLPTGGSAVFHVLEVRFERKELKETLIETLQVPRIRRDVFISEFLENGVHHVFEHLAQRRRQVVTPENLFSLTIDHLPLLVHDVIVFQEMLSDIEVLCFHAFLGVLYGPADETVLDGLAFFQADLVHDRGYSLGAENPKEIVLQGEIETGRAPVTLAA